MAQWNGTLTALFFAVIFKQVTDMSCILNYDPQVFVVKQYQTSTGDHSYTMHFTCQRNDTKLSFNIAYFPPSPQHSYKYLYTWLFHKKTDSNLPRSSVKVTLYLIPHTLNCYESVILLIYDFRSICIFTIHSCTSLWTSEVIYGRLATEHAVKLGSGSKALHIIMWKFSLFSVCTLICAV